MQTCAASAASSPSGIATIAVRGVIRSLTGRCANASTPDTTAISPAEARAPVSAPDSTAASVVRRDRRGGGDDAHGGERVGGGEHPARIVEYPGRGPPPAQLVRDPAGELELAHGGRRDADRRRGAGDEEPENQHDEGEGHFRWKQTRVTRRRSTRSTTTRNPSSVSSSPGRGTRPSAE